MSTLKLLIGIFIIVIAIVFAGYYVTEIRPQSSSSQDEGTQQQASPEQKAPTEAGANNDAVPTPRTATTTLPSMTNNAWEMNEIKLPNTKGEVHSLNEWKGKVIMLNFWASWCAPCQFEIPRFVNYQETYADKGLQIIGLGLDKADKLGNVERSLEMNYPTLVIPEEDQAKLMTKWGNAESIVPYTVIIASDGTMEYIHRGALDDDAFQRHVLPLLNK